MENREFKKLARKRLGGDIFSSMWMMPLLCCLISSAILSEATGISFGIASLIIIGPLSFGISRIFIKLSRSDENAKVIDLFSGFRENCGDNILLGLISKIFIMLWSCLLIVPGIVKSYSYAMIYNIKNDNPNLDYIECITESRKMMNGYKWKLFCLDLSFIGWYIVGFICFGVGTLWVVPYHKMAQQYFYEDIRGNEQSQITAVNA